MMRACISITGWGRNLIPSPVISVILLLLAAPCWSAGTGGDLMRAEVDLSDRKSLQRGARTFRKLLPQLPFGLVHAL